MLVVDLPGTMPNRAPARAALPTCRATMRTRLNSTRASRSTKTADAPTANPSAPVPVLGLPRLWGGRLTGRIIFTPGWGGVGLEKRGDGLFLSRFSLYSCTFFWGEGQKNLPTPKLLRRTGN